MEEVKAELAEMRKAIGTLTEEVKQLRLAIKTNENSFAPLSIKNIPPETGSVIDKALFEQLESCADEDSPDFVEEVVQLFFDGLAEKMPELERQLAEGDLEEMSKTAHYLKGSSGGIGALRLVNIFKELRIVAERKDIPECNVTVLRVKREVGEVEKALKERGVAFRFRSYVLP